MRYPASSEIIPASVLPWDTAVCLLQAHEIGTSVCDPNIDRKTHLKLNLSLLKFLQNWRLGRIPVFSLLLNFQRDSAVCSWMSNLLSKVDLVFQFSPDTSISNNLRPNLCRFSCSFQIFCFYLVIAQKKCGNFVELVNRLVRQFAKAFNTFFSVTFHAVAPCCDVFGIFLIIFADQLREQFLLFHHNSGIDLLLAENIQEIPEQ